VPRLRRLTTALVAALALAAGTAGCGSATDSGPATASGDPARCPGPVLDVVVSVGQWGQVVGPLAGPCATVTTVLTSSAVDPHDYEPTTGDLAALQEADLVVVNGDGYDVWAQRAVTGLSGGPAVVAAADVARAAGDPLVDPHLWYSPALVPRVAAAVTARLTALAPRDAAVFTEQAAALSLALQRYDASLAALRPLAQGHSYAATETVFDRTAHALGLTDRTPPGYRRAVSNDSDPAPGDVAALEQALREGAVDVLVVNTQTEGNLPRELVAAATRGRVPVVRVTESPPPGTTSFAGWQSAQLDQLAAALGSAR
jgi:zinc/manganese transport system substrate-binding protein